MAMTLADANKLTMDTLVQGIVETILNEGRDLMNRLPFELADGIQFTYVRESTLPSVDFYDPNEVITESSGTHSTVSITLTSLLGDSDLNKLLLKTKSNINNLEAEYTRMAVKAAFEKFLDTLFYGQKDPVVTKAFKGFWAHVDSTMVTKANGASATGAAMSLAKLDTMIDAIRPGRPDLLIMNRTVRRRLTQAMRDSTAGIGANLILTPDAFGRPILHYAEIPIFVTDYLLATELMDASGNFSAKTGGVTNSVWAVRFGSAAEGGFFAIHGGDASYELEIIDPVPNKDSKRFRIKWYVGTGIGQVKSLAAYTNITDAAVTA